MNAPFEPLDILLENIIEEVADTLYPPGRRVQLSLAYYRIVLEHHNAIARLLEIRLHASAFALARPLYEALIKGMWLGLIATEEVAERHARGKELDQVAPLIEQLQSTELPPVVSAQLQKVKQKYWKVLSSLTHAGHAQVRNWLNATGVQPAYEPAALEELVNFACFMALSAGVEMARLGGNARAIENLSAMLPPHTDN
jgi:hypothetical protein